MQLAYTVLNCARKLRVLQPLDPLEKRHYARGRRYTDSSRFAMEANGQGKYPVYLSCGYFVCQYKLKKREICIVCVKVILCVHNPLAAFTMRVYVLKTRVFATRLR